MRIPTPILALAVLGMLSGGPGSRLSAAVRDEPLIADHACCDLSQVPLAAIEAARTDLSIAYGHTSHGSQITTGMTGLAGFAGAPNPPEAYAWNETGAGGALRLDDYFVPGDLGNPDFTTFASRTRTFLDQPAHAGVNVVMWSWCGQVSYASTTDIDTYLSLMSGLETDYPGVTFVYMTGHLDGTGTAGTLNQNNERIRAHCRNGNRVLFDFADIESYDPEGNEYLSRDGTDACEYFDGSDVRNWAAEWQNTHTEGVDWYSCESAHSEPLNANRKAFAAWWLFARLAGWDGGAAVGVDFTATPRRGEFPLLVQFTDTSTIEPLAWAWNFGDGGNSPEQHPAHQFVNCGTYTVTLTVTAADGDHVRIRDIVLADEHPSRRRAAGKIAVEPKQPLAGAPVTFTAACRYASSWRWTFPGGDPATALGPGPHEVLFAAPGKTTVLLELGNSSRPGKLLRKPLRLR
ncbi:MAG: PKD domain-containing protein [Planctomycetes bacterium]|jgi:hypothetical protein|nr:PKD domain-containing protein [Planctomycetota bacterium]